MDEAYRIYSPLASMSFHDLIFSSPSIEECTIFFKQFLEGVACLHSTGLMHRDIIQET